ncbi:MAG: Putative lipoprotein [uncultured Sulfurovum sp.]|uniref:Lipoprotein n=1 Tax=uncultured Sulfurovum sp. TaxID=269237 RepID=A0A6S6TUP0_9BACT|nr:MAG: Putative lipoprotein [uncultured Sulfurovum sp.]
MLRKLSMIITISALFVACTGKDAKKQESALIVMKTKTIKFSDMGFIYSNALGVKVEVYAAGQPLLDLNINAENICLSLLKCMDKQQFNEEVLVAEYPSTLLENIFKAKPIFSRKNFKEIEGGFEQQISKEDVYDISYSVVSGKRIFRDKINKILIKVREQ